MSEPGFLNLIPGSYGLRIEIRKMRWVLEVKYYVMEYL